MFGFDSLRSTSSSLLVLTLLSVAKLQQEKEGRKEGGEEFDETAGTLSLTFFFREIHLISLIAHIYILDIMM